MGDKSAQKQRYILEKARQVFMEKGYKLVTMKDIVEACGISRGGLYLYFDGTKQLFEQVLVMETQEADDLFAKSLSEDATPADILALFLKEQKKELVGKEASLTKAIYEYYFACQTIGKDNLLRKQFDQAVHVLEKLIDAGCQSGEFYCEDPRGAARNIMYVLEGLKIAACTRGVSEAMVDREILYVMQGLVTEE